MQAHLACLLLKPLPWMYSSGCSWRTWLLLQPKAGGLPCAAYWSRWRVFVGCIWLEDAELLAQYRNSSRSVLVTGNGLAFMAGRLSYTFGLSG